MCMYILKFMYNSNGNLHYSQHLRKKDKLVPSNIPYVQIIDGNTIMYLRFLTTDTSWS